MPFLGNLQRVKKRLYQTNYKSSGENCMTLMDPLLLHEAWLMLYNNNQTHIIHIMGLVGYTIVAASDALMLTSELTVTVLFKNTQAVKFKSGLHNGVLHYHQS